MAREASGSAPARAATRGSDRATAPDLVGGYLRAQRERSGIGVRELAVRIGVSPSLISQVERGKSRPSVGTLYAISEELGLSLDQMLRELGGDGPKGSDGEAERSIVRKGSGAVFELGSGVLWERLTEERGADVDFLQVSYDVGGASTLDATLVRHSGREYGYVLRGQLGVTVGFETHELGAGDAISFDSALPHRLFNAGSSPVQGIWLVLGRGQSDRRVLRRRDKNGGSDGSP